MRMVRASVHGAIDPTALRKEGVDPETVVDFSSNQSPLGAAPAVALAVGGAVIDAYPDPRAAELCEVIAERHAVAADQVVCGNGSTELIRLVAQLSLDSGERAVALAPVFGECEVATALAGAEAVLVPLEHAGHGMGFTSPEDRLRSALIESRARLCWLCSPNNPTGAALPQGLVRGLVREHPDVLFVLDEAYCDLLSEVQWPVDLLDGGNLIVLRSMTKYWGLAGARLGYALAGRGTSNTLRAAAPPWSVNAFAQAAGLAALADRGHHQRSVDLLVSERDRLVSGLHELGWTTEPSAAGFFLIHAGDAVELRRKLLGRGCLVRDCTSFGLPSHIRVSPRHPRQNDLLLAAFAELAPPEAVA
jgi:threonine-phosphate decarboxylase